ncbi:MAG: hypothetical protein WC238_00075 [Parcubacteria group bacterium]|jgi:hypothetical protein
MKITKIIRKLGEIGKKSNTAVCDVFLCKTNRKRDLIIIAISVFVASIIIADSRYSLVNLLKRNIQANKVVEDTVAAPEVRVYEQVKAIQETIDTSKWKNYQSQWYGVELKYPEQWGNPIHRSATRGTKWEYRSQFRSETVGANNPYVGFDLVIYPIAVIKEATNTDEFPKIKSPELKEKESCAMFDGHLIETGDYAAEEIYVPAEDDCYDAALYFSFTRDAYVYNLVPVMRDGYERTSDPMVDVADHFPEFFSVASQLSTIDIVRPKPKAVATPTPKVVSAPQPYIYKKDSVGRRVCGTKNDKPAKSKKNKSRHMDMECCLDPDEYPNPNCYYDPAKYGKYL